MSGVLTVLPDLIFLGNVFGSVHILVLANSNALFGHSKTTPHGEPNSPSIASPTTLQVVQRPPTGKHGYHFAGDGCRGCGAPTPSRRTKYVPWKLFRPVKSSQTLHRRNPGSSGIKLVSSPRITNTKGTQGFFTGLLLCGERPANQCPLCALLLFPQKRTMTSKVIVSHADFLFFLPKRESASKSGYFITIPWYRCVVCNHGIRNTLVRCEVCQLATQDVFR